MRRCSTTGTYTSAAQQAHFACGAKCLINVPSVQRCAGSYVLFEQRRCAQAHCVREKSPAFGSWRQELLLAVDGVLRRCGAAYPLPASVMYNSTQGELHRIESEWAADPQQLQNGQAPRAQAPSVDPRLA